MREYRVIDYDDRWYAEVQSSQGVWEILGNFATKAEAEEKINQVKEENEAAEFVGEWLPEIIFCVIILAILFGVAALSTIDKQPCGCREKPENPFAQDYGTVRIEKKGEQE